ncbi:MAG: RNA polymerase sigma factor [Blautia sp.]|nr:RNA polymerase sigma factor [Lachnoclostridium sp.]MCM1212732.1 RNA polymerase sigma factor [Blautia sp.]
MDLDEQYNKIYRYCYFRLHRREIAEDITQETFLRFLESHDYVNTGKTMQYLYTIARNLCIDEYRKQKTEIMDDEVVDIYAEDNMITRISVRTALAELNEADRELLLLRYVNEVPVSVICKLYGISRFAVYRKISQATKNLKEKLGKEDFT